MGVQGRIEFVLRFIGCAVPDGAVRAFGVVPGEPFQSLPLDLRHGLPRAQEFDDLGFEQADDALGERVVVSDQPPRSGPLSLLVH